MSEPTIGVEPTALCARCANPVQLGAAFCRLCGAVVAGRVVAPPEETVPTPASEPPSDVPSIYSGIHPARPLVRAAAWFIDAAVVVLALFVIVVVARVSGVPEVVYTTGPVAVVALWIWSLVWHATSGTSFGKSALGLRIVNSSDLSPLGFDHSAIRSLVVLVSLGTASASILLDRSGWYRGWHDAASSSVVIDVLGGSNPLGPRVVTTVLRRPDRGLRSIESPVPLRVVAAPTSPPPPPPRVDA